MAEVIAADVLRKLIERVERLEEEKKGLMQDIEEVFVEAKDHGFDVEIMKQVIKLRGMAKHKRQEAEALLETYLAALGMVG
ncbi:DUF2312 domain-containing protein [Pedomonas sp. V897]|uniref:DUF2312 domain-containing protein n=1 Tax=Pedomonas sp. V897 TaxID=3446482 RepID=UPI003EE19FFC